MFNPFMPGSLKRDTGKQHRHRSDVAECSVWSGSTLFALSTGISVNHGNNKNYPDTPFTGNGPVQRVKVEESSWHKWVNFQCHGCKSTLNSCEFVSQSKTVILAEWANKKTTHLKCRNRITWCIPDSWHETTWSSEEFYWRQQDIENGQSKTGSSLFILWIRIRIFTKQRFQTRCIDTKLK